MCVVDFGHDVAVFCMMSWYLRNVLCDTLADALCDTCGTLADVL